MKIKFISIKANEQFNHKGKNVKVGDEIDLAKERAEHFIEQGIAEAVKESPKQSQAAKK